MPRVMTLLFLRLKSSPFSIAQSANAMMDVGWKTSMIDLRVVYVNHVVGKYEFGGSIIDKYGK